MDRLFVRLNLDEVAALDLLTNLFSADSVWGGYVSGRNGMLKDMDH